MVRRTDWEQEMEITPLLTSVRKWGAPGRFVKKIFLGGRSEAAELVISTVLKERIFLELLKFEQRPQ